MTCATATLGALAPLVAHGGLVWALRPLTLHHHPFLVRQIIANLILTLTLTLTLSLTLTLILL